MRTILRYMVNNVSLDGALATRASQCLHPSGGGRREESLSVETPGFKVFSRPERVQEPQSTGRWQNAVPTPPHRAGSPACPSGRYPGESPSLLEIFAGSH